MNSTIKTATFFYDTKAVSGIHELLDQFGPGTLASPLRSTLPLIAMIKDDPDTLLRVMAACGIPSVTEIHLEYRVKSPRGTGKASHTDAMVFGETASIAFEAKWTEDRYEDLSSWLNAGQSESKNREEVATGWLELLQRHSTGQLRLEDFGNTVYQLLHRAASACSTELTPNLAYLHFHTDEEAGSGDSYYADLSALQRVLRYPKGFGFHVVEVPLHPTEAFTKIESLRRGALETDAAVRNALLDSRLFEFGSARVRSLREC